MAVWNENLRWDNQCGKKLEQLAHTLKAGSEMGGLSWLRAAIACKDAKSATFKAHHWIMHGIAKRARFVRLNGCNGSTQSFMTRQGFFLSQLRKEEAHHTCKDVWWAEDISCFLAADLDLAFSCRAFVYLNSDRRQKGKHTPCAWDAVYLWLNLLLAHGASSFRRKMGSFNFTASNQGTFYEHCSRPATQNSE